MSADWVLDLGHSRIKWARSSDNGLLESIGSCPIEHPAPLETVLLESAGDHLWASAQSHPEAVDWLANMAQQRGLDLTILATGHADLPVRPAYEGLGSDRWLATQWPWQQSGVALCVIDCGTALTIDVVDNVGTHRGGWIMPGLSTAREGLLGKAPGLPRRLGPMEADEKPALDSTRAIATGTLLQMAGAIERAVNAAGNELAQDPVIWITGGDAGAIMPMTRLQATLDEHLVLRGLAMAANRC